MSDADNIYGLRTLSYFTGVKMSFLIDDGLIDDALTVGLYRQRLLEKMERTEGVQAAYLDLQKSYLYSKLAYLYYRLGDKRKAEECLRSINQLKPRQPLPGNTMLLLICSSQVNIRRYWIIVVT